MRRLIIRDRGDDGASMVLAAIVLFAMLAVAALAIDTARLVQERRTLQSSADAAALAVAQDCAGATGCGVSLATATGYANANADDHVSAVSAICGLDPKNGSLTACTDPPPGLPAGVGYVRVTTESRDPD